MDGPTGQAGAIHAQLPSAALFRLTHNVSLSGQSAGCKTISHCDISRVPCAGQCLLVEPGLPRLAARGPDDTNRLTRGRPGLLRLFHLLLVDRRERTPMHAPTGAGFAWNIGGVRVSRRGARGIKLHLAQRRMPARMPSMVDYGGVRDAITSVVPGRPLADSRRS